MHFLQYKNCQGSIQSPLDGEEKQGWPLDMKEQKELPSNKREGFWSLWVASLGTQKVKKLEQRKLWKANLLELRSFLS